ncbi:MAG TPA: NFACT RNA binding domain-containing protein [Pyrinomonadaceae bacterium]|jgi:predicted ribosome quality control (RQC) complex YloA/Tae2 family protein|nr:NFACT RNA binding domain-containing protein [Pyrinomonadaceae bacterium]
MDDATIAAVVAEIAPLIVGRAPGKIFQLSPYALAIDYGLRGDGYLFFSVEPALPRMYLIKRRVRDLEKQSLRLGNFGLSLRKELAGTNLSSIQKIVSDRVVWFKYSGRNEIGEPVDRSLVAQLTGRSANLLLVSEEHRIIAQLREGQGAGQKVGETYQSPPTRSPTNKPDTNPAEYPKSVSESLDEHYLALTAKQTSDSRLASVRAQLRKEISRRQKLQKQLQNDLSTHANAENEKRIGDLLLANVTTAKRRGTTVVLTDYFADDAPAIEIEVDESLTLAEEASRRFESYARSKRARKQIAARIETVKAELAELNTQFEDLQQNPPTADVHLAPASDSRPPPSDGASKTRIPGTRRYVSSDGYEILVGRAARDNDNLTFKIAKPNDLWLHAADYSGSHVVVRNTTRKDIPHRTLIEAAQLAAHFSQAKKDLKVDVHYTERKFLSKPKHAAPGLVRMLRFKNITVAPLEAGERVK